MIPRATILSLGGQAILDRTAELARRVKATGNPCCGCWCDACPFDYAGFRDEKLREVARERQRAVFNL